VLEQLNCTEKGGEDTKTMVSTLAFLSILVQNLRCILLLPHASQLGEI